MTRSFNRASDLDLPDVDIALGLKKIIMLKAKILSMCNLDNIDVRAALINLAATCMKLKPHIKPHQPLRPETRYQLPQIAK
jgi:hypothetical protein